MARGLCELTAVLTAHLAPPGMRLLDAIQEANMVMLGLVEDRAVVSPIAALPDALDRRFAELGGSP